jgi:O-antigen/teichoic acid export membrane protein
MPTVTRTPAAFAASVMNATNEACGGQLVMRAPTRAIVAAVGDSGTVGTVAASVRTNLIANYSGALLSSVLSLVFAPIYVKLLGPEAFGLVGFFTSAVSIATFLDLGLGSALNRELARRMAAGADADETRDLVKSVERIYVSIGAGVGLVFIAGAPLAARFLFKPSALSVDQVTSSLMIMGAALGLRWCASLYIAGLSGLQQQVPVNVINVSIAAAQYGGAIIVLQLLGASVGTFFVYQGVMGLIQTLTLRAVFLRRLPAGTRPAKWNRGLLDHLRQFAIGLTGISITAAFLTQADRLVLSAVMPLKTFGYYVFAANAAMALGRIVSPIFNAVYPRITALVAARDAKALAAFYHKTSQLMALLVIPLAATLVVFTEPVLLFWTRQPELVAAAALPFRLLMIGYAFNALMNVPYALQLAHGWTSLALVVNVCWLVILFPGLWLGYNVYGMVAAASLWPVLNLCYLLITIPLMHARIEKQLMWRWYAFSVALPLVVSTAIAIMGRVVAGTSSNILYGLLTGAVAFTATLAALPSARGELAPILQRFRRRSPQPAP